MNPLLQVKLRFSNEKNSNTYGVRNLRAGSKVTAEDIDQLIENIHSVITFYHGVPQIIQDILIDVNYNDIIAKSNRVKELFKPVGKDANDVVVGARFSDSDNGKENHIITYYVDNETINRTIDKLKIARDFLNDQLNGEATPDNFNETAKLHPCIDYTGYRLKKTCIRNIIVDCSVISSCSVPHIDDMPDKESFLITFYKTELGLPTLLEKLGIDNSIYRYSFYGEDTIAAPRDMYQIIKDRVPYLISMVSSDFSKITMDEIMGSKELPNITIPSPSDEPVIGVIDTLFDENVYFNEWVQNTDYLEDFEKDSVSNADREHGTEITSIIVDGPRMNPWLDDGCGRFQVKHFGVCVNKISVSRLVRKIREIVNQNPEIHVWNLSLGTDEEVSKNFISYDAAALDELQYQKNVIFVISGTNDIREQKSGTLRVGSPADSLNSIVVNSVRRSGQPSSYSRKGNVLSFFTKPDVSYYGGDFGEEIIAYSSTMGEKGVCGTSFAAPWISRKMCYLIDVMGFPKEIAKALIIDAAAGWEYKVSTYYHKDIMGYGIVPIDVNKILTSSSDEIKFFVYNSSESYKTTNYSIPVPKDESNKYPYIARAVLCYFPSCSRSQGVDYTNRELSLKFGRVKNNGDIEDINDNCQDDESVYVDERQSRKEFRKWENTKFISKICRNNRPVISYEDRLWGLSVTSKERLNTSTKENLNFGIVITLKEINGINRVQDFIKACTLRGWIVNEIDVDNQIEIYNKNQEEIAFD